MLKVRSLNPIGRGRVERRGISWILSPGKEDQVCRLRKVLYGLKHAPCAWYQWIDDFVIRIGLHRTSQIPTSIIYVIIGRGLAAIVIVYVDGLIFTCSWMEKTWFIMTYLEQEFEMRTFIVAKRE